MMRPLWNTSKMNAHACSVGLKSGDLAGQFITLISVSSMKVMDTRAMCARALSCITLHYNESITNSACMLPNNMLQNIATMYCCRYSTSRKHIQPSKSQKIFFVCESRTFSIVYSSNNLARITGMYDHPRESRSTS